MWKLPDPTQPRPSKNAVDWKTGLSLSIPLEYQQYDEVLSDADKARLDALRAEYHIVLGPFVKTLQDHLETKLGHVRDVEYWGLPYGTPITPGMKPKKKKNKLDFVRKETTPQSVVYEAREPRKGKPKVDLLCCIYNSKGGRKRAQVRDYARPENGVYPYTSLILPRTMTEYFSDESDQEILDFLDPFLSAYAKREQTADTPFVIDSALETQGWKKHYDGWQRKKYKGDTTIFLCENLVNTATWNHESKEGELQKRFENRYYCTGTVYDEKGHLAGRWEVFGNDQNDVIRQIIDLTEPEYEKVVAREENVLRGQEERIREQVHKTSNLPVLTTDKPLPTLPMDRPTEPVSVMQFSSPGVRPEFSTNRNRAMEYDTDAMIKAHTVDSLAPQIRQSLESTEAGRAWLDNETAALVKRWGTSTGFTRNDEIAKRLREQGRQEKDIETTLDKLYLLFRSKDTDQSHMFQFTEDELDQLHALDEDSNFCNYGLLLQDFSLGDRYQKQLDLMVNVADRLSPEDIAVRWETSKWIKNWAGTSADSSPESLALQKVVARAIAPDSYEEHFPAYEGAETINADLPFISAFIAASYGDTQKFFKEHGVTKMRMYRGMAMYPYPDEFKQLQEKLDSGELVAPIESYRRIVPDAFDTGYALVATKQWLEQTVPYTDKPHMDFTTLVAKSLLDGNTFQDIMHEMVLPNIPKTTLPAAVDLQPLSSWSTYRPVAESFDSHGSGEPFVLEADIPVERIFSTALTGNGCFSEQEAVVFGGTYEANITASKLRHRVDNMSFHQVPGNVMDDPIITDETLKVALENPDTSPAVLAVFKHQIDLLHDSPAALREHLLKNYSGDSALINKLQRDGLKLERAEDSRGYLAIQQRVEKYGGVEPRWEYAMFRALGYTQQETVDLLKIYYNLEG